MSNLHIIITVELRIVTDYVENYVIFVSNCWLWFLKISFCWISSYLLVFVCVWFILIPVDITLCIDQVSPILIIYFPILMTDNNMDYIVSHILLWQSTVLISSAAQYRINFNIFYNKIQYLKNYVYRHSYTVQLT